MRELEPERRENGVFLVAAGGHPLHHAAAAAGLRARIPRGPPLHENHDEEDVERHPGVGGAKVRKLRICSPPACPAARRSRSADIPPTWSTAKNAKTMQPPMARRNWMKSVTTTPQSPERVLA